MKIQEKTQSYTSPKVEVLEIEIEKGFAVSDPLHGEVDPNGGGVEGGVDF